MKDEYEVVVDFRYDPQLEKDIIQFVGMDPWSGGATLIGEPDSQECDMEFDGHTKASATELAAKINTKFGGLVTAYINYIG